MAKKLEDELQKIKESQESNQQKENTYLGFADEVIKKISEEYPGGLPQKILLPLPKFLQS